MKTIIQFFRRHHVLITIPIVILCFFIAVPLLRAADPTAATFDAGIFQAPIFAIFLFFLFLAVAWLALRIIFGNFYRFLRDEMKTNFQNLTEWQKLKLTYSLYFALLAALVLLFRGVM